MRTTLLLAAGYLTLYLASTAASAGLVATALALAFVAGVPLGMGGARVGDALADWYCGN